MQYNQTENNGVPMPLLMGYTQVEAVEENLLPDISFYDPISQTLICGTVSTHNTRSIRGVATLPTRIQDKKTMNDDKKVY